ncbi:FKBP-type peptidyl-prolyl cis-trans isomerase [Halomonas sp. WWR20]
MKKLVTAVAFGSLLTAPLFALAAPQSDEEKLSYSIGATLGQSLVQDIDNLDIEAFTQAIEDVYSDEELQMSQEDMMQTLSQFQQEKTAAREQEMKQLAEQNREASEAFLAENAKKEGVQVTDSGLQYKELESGDGESPSADSTVKVHYEGTLPDGTVFDSSYKRGEPISFRVDQVIEGWQEALPMMQVGDTWMLYVPSDLAYGPAGTGGPIGPNQALAFKVELLGIEDGDANQDDASSSEE